MRMQVLALLASGVLLAAGSSPEKTANVGKKNLWAAISVNAPVFDVAGPEPVNIYFALVNDGVKTVNSDVESSQMFVNGKELEDWPFIIGGGGIRDDRWQALPPGDYLFFRYDLSGHFRKPGIYRVSWKGKSFQSPEIVFRIMPKHER